MILLQHSITLLYIFNTLFSFNVNFLIYSPKSPKTSIQQNNGERPIQVEDRVFIGGRQIAQNKTVLLTYGITHVLNAAPSMCDNYHQSDRSFTYKIVRIFEKQNNNGK